MIELQVCDLHNHTLRSPDGFCTLAELISKACEIGIKWLGITEHGPAMAGSPNADYFTISNFVPPLMDGVVVLIGIECNILDSSGQLDLDDSLLSEQDIVVAGLHSFCGYPPSLGPVNNTQSLLRAIAHPQVDIISHPFRSDFPVHFEEVVEGAFRNGVLLELNLGMLRSSGLSSDNLDILKRMTDVCRQRGLPIALSSDTHVVPQLGEYELLNVLGLKPCDPVFWKPSNNMALRLNRRLRRKAKFQQILNQHTYADHL